MTELSAGAAGESVVAKQPPEIAKKSKSRTRKPRRYIAPQKGRDWYEKAGDKIAIKQNTTGTPRRRT
jgi:hypothetical protein